MKSLDSIKNAFKTPERSNESSNFSNNYFPFWNIPEGAQTVIRFLPDANEDNPTGFLVEKTMHHLTISGERKNVPCLSMYGEPCPICAVSQQYYKAEDKEKGKLYWKKKQNLAQCIVVEDPMPADETGETHEGKVRFVALGFQIYNIIKGAFEDGELDEVPFAYEGGTDFIIKKTKQGDYPSYAIGTKFARRATDLDEDVIANIELVDLSTLLPKHPGLERVEAMLEASLTGSDYTESSSTTSMPVPKKPVVETSKASVVDVEEDDDSLDREAEDILADIRKRKAKKSGA